MHTHKTFNKNSIIIKINFETFGYIILYICYYYWLLQSEKQFLPSLHNFLIIEKKINVVEFFFEHQVEADGLLREWKKSREREKKKNEI